MAFNDLTVQAQDGLNYAANRLSAEDKARKGATMPDPANPTGPPIPRPDLYPTGRAYMDFGAEVDGCKWYETKQETRRLKRIAALEKPANSALAAQVDALG
jgi:hypothetical protein